MTFWLRGALLASCLALLPVAAFADDPDEIPPADGKRLSEIIRSVEEGGYGQVTGVDFDEHRWEIEVRKDGMEREIHVDPKTGSVMSGVGTAP